MPPVKTSRRPDYDLLRCLAAGCVILLHVLSPIHTNAAIFGTRLWWLVNLLNEISRAGVPIFLMLTGALLLPAASTQQFGSFYRRRLTKILIPFICWDVIYYLVKCYRAGTSVFSRAFIDDLLNQGSAYHLWYVYMLAGIYLILPFLSRALASCTNRQIFWLSVIAFFPGTLRPIFNLSTPFYLFLSEPLLECYLGYVILGFWLSRINLGRKTVIAIPILALGGIAIGALCNFFRSTPEALDFYFNGGYGINHILLASGLFLAARHIPLSRTPALCHVFGRLSPLTYQMYLAHVLVLSVIEQLLPLPAKWTIPVYTALTVLAAGLLAWGIATVSNLLRRKEKPHASL